MIEGLEPQNCGRPPFMASFLFDKTVVLMGPGTLQVIPNYGTEDFSPKSCMLVHQIRYFCC